MYLNQHNKKLVQHIKDTKKIRYNLNNFYYIFKLDFLTMLIHSNQSNKQHEITKNNQVNLCIYKQNKKTKTMTNEDIILFLVLGSLYITKISFYFLKLFNILL